MAMLYIKTQVPFMNSKLKYLTVFVETMYFFILWQDKRTYKKSLTKQKIRFLYLVWS